MEESSTSFLSFFSCSRKRKVDTARYEIQRLKETILNRYNGKDISKDETKILDYRKPRPPDWVRPA